MVVAVLTASDVKRLCCGVLACNSLGLQSLRSLLILLRSFLSFLLLLFFWMLTEFVTEAAATTAAAAVAILYNVRKSEKLMISHWKRF